MWRYIRLFFYFLRFSFSRAMEFRVDFFFRIVMDIVYYAINILFFQVIYLHTPLLGGWRQDQMMVFVAGFLIIDALSMTLFANNLWFLSLAVNRGDLDYYLVRPVSSLFFLSLRDFAANSFVNLLLSWVILVLALIGYRGSVGIVEVVLYVLLLLNGTFLRYCVRMLTIIPVFWLHAARGFEMVFFHLNRFLERPDAIFNGWMRRLLVTLLPFGLMASFPARIFIDGFSWRLLAHICGVTVLFFSLVTLFWKAGLKAYSSASS